jgi:quercetin dioxygenase-like cupin family protein
MREYLFDAARQAPVSHDPGLMKRVLVEEPVSCIRRISHITLNPGDTAKEHAHPDDHELFYCIRGLLTVSVSGESVTLKEGDVLVVDPGEPHSIVEVGAPTEILYMRVAPKQP